MDSQNNMNSMIHGRLFNLIRRIWNDAKNKEEMRYSSPLEARSTVIDYKNKYDTFNEWLEDIGYELLNNKKLEVMEEQENYGYEGTAPDYGESVFGEGVVTTDRTEEELKIQCIKMAIKYYQSGSGTGNDIVKAAKKFYDFIKGKE